MIIIFTSLKRTLSAELNYVRTLFILEYVHSERYVYMLMEPTNYENSKTNKHLIKHNLQ